MSQLQDDESPWWRPEVLAESERAFRSISDLEALDPKNDFGSYRRMLLGDSTKASNIGSHNDLDPLRKIQAISCALRLDPSLHYSILDVGCGLGFTADAIAQVFRGATVTGVDISNDAITYARSRFPHLRFDVRTISENAEVIGTFDIIFCVEFYPFTRTIDFVFQSSIIRYLSRNLNRTGFVVIFQKWNNAHSLSAVLDDVERTCPELRFDVRLMPHYKLPRWIPRFVALALSGFVQLFRPESVRRIITVHPTS